MQVSFCGSWVALTPGRGLGDSEIRVDDSNNPGRRLNKSVDGFVYDDAGKVQMPWGRAGVASFTVCSLQAKVGPTCVCVCVCVGVFVHNLVLGSKQNLLQARQQEHAFGVNPS